MFYQNSPDHFIVFAHFCQCNLILLFLSELEYSRIRLHILYVVLYNKTQLDYFLGTLKIIFFLVWFHVSLPFTVTVLGKS